MSADPRSRLAAQAAAAGYPPDLLAVIAHATLPAYRADSLAQHTGDYRRRHGEDWRQPFWARALALASVRYRRPDIYGLSPCETDPDRLAKHAASQAAARPA